MKKSKKITSRTRDAVIWDDTLTSVDLAPLAPLVGLREVFVRSEKLRSIDLSPLRGKAIEKLQIVAPIDELDLSPITGSKTLAELLLSHGPSKVDLAPLTGCPVLREVFIWDAPLASLDLAPLASCAALSIMWLSTLKLVELDLTPLSKLPAFHAIDLSRSQLVRVELGTKPAFAPLTHIHFSGNPLASLDLRALAGAKGLRAVTLPIELRGLVDISMLAPTNPKMLEIEYR